MNLLFYSETIAAEEADLNDDEDDELDALNNVGLLLVFICSTFQDNDLPIEELLRRYGAPMPSSSTTTGESDELPAKRRRRAPVIEQVDIDVVVEASQDVLQRYV
jgi:hypothetical protein